MQPEIFTFAELFASIEPRQIWLADAASGLQTYVVLKKTPPDHCWLAPVTGDTAIGGDICIEHIQRFRKHIGYLSPAEFQRLTQRSQPILDALSQRQLF